MQGCLQKKLKIVNPMKVRKIIKKIIRRDTDLKKDGLYIKHYSPFTIFSNYQKALGFLFDQIFIDQVYNFQTKSKEPLIIDAGANMGFAVLFWKLKYPEAKIIAIEPSKEVFKVLEKNIIENKIRNVTTINKALWNKTTELEFTSDEKISGSLILEKNLETKYIVQTITLKEIIHSPVDLLKIDIEGAEIFILDQLEEVINFVSNIFIEYHSFIHQEQCLSKILSILENNNFRYYIEGEYKNPAPLTNLKVRLNQDLQLNIWGKRK